MKLYLSYFARIWKHKYLVFRAGLKVGGISFWRLAIHDWTKFLPSEFGAYARDGRGHYGDGRTMDSDEFQVAWLWHENRNAHHLGFWVARSGKLAGQPLPMPESYVREMIADWMAASYARTGLWDFSEWANENLSSFLIHSETRQTISDIMTGLDYV